MQYFQDKVAWITGASSGIGEALSHALVAAGARIIISSRNEAELERVKASSSDPQKVRIIPVDLQDSAALEEKTRLAWSAYGHIDIMVHNGGISQRSYVRETSMSVHRKVMEVDYFSYVEITRQLLPHFEQRGSGHFVVISSVMGKIGTPMRSAYAAAKHALHGFFDCLRAELASSSIAVTVITPGYIQTKVTLNALTGDGSALGNIGHHIANGLPPEKAASQILQAVAARKYEAYVGKPGQEKLALLINRFAPNFLIRMASKQIPK